jgi:hypothetical protein
LSVFRRRIGTNAERGGWAALTGDLEVAGGKMTFTVVWRPEAERVLAALWNTAPDRQSLTDAADAIDILLRSEPLGVGESRVVNIRILTVFPLSVYYDVHEDDRLVAVWAVWRVRES